MKFPLHTIRQEPNKCGECRACCTALGVGELNKPIYTPCIHECNQGCSIYDQRPDSCKIYYCLYQIGALKGGISNRPDKLGMIFDFQVTTTGREKVISAWELRPGAMNERRVREVINGIAEKFVVVVRYHNSDQVRVFGPPHLLNDVVVNIN